MRRVDVAMLLIFSAVEAATARLTVFFIIVPSHVQYHVLCRCRRPGQISRQAHRHEDPNVQVNDSQTEHDGLHGNPFFGLIGRMTFAAKQLKDDQVRLFSGRPTNQFIEIKQLEDGQVRLFSGRPTKQ